jgi:hypothetical protein
MIRDFKIFEAKKYKNSISVKDIYDRCNNDPDIIIDKLMKVFRDKNINLRDKDDRIVWPGDDKNIRSFNYHGKKDNGELIIRINDASDIYPSDYIVWNDPEIRISELDPYGEEDWNEELEKYAYVNENLFNLFNRKSKITPHSDIDPYGEEDWDEKNYEEIFFEFLEKENVLDKYIKNRGNRNVSRTEPERWISSAFSWDSMLWIDIDNKWKRYLRKYKKKN